MKTKRNSHPRPAAARFAQQSIRFSTVQSDWLRAEGAQQRASINELVRRLVDDRRTFFGLAPTLCAALEEDRVALGLDSRTYLQELLTLRYAKVLREQLERERDEGGAASVRSPVNSRSDE